MWTNFRVWVFCVVIGLSGLTLSVARADSGTLIVLQGIDDPNSTYRAVIERLNHVSVVNNLSSRYARIDFLSDSEASPQSLFDRISSRGAFGPVDVMVLAPGSGESLHLRSGELDAWNLSSLPRFQNLRLVYMNAGSSDALVGGWLRAGAQLVIAQATDPNVSGLFFPRFIRDLSQGRSAADSARDAHRWTVASFAKIQDFLRHDSRVAASEPPRIQGRDFDYDGLTRGRVAEWLEDDQIQAPLNSPFYSHPDFQRFSIQIMSSAIPQAAIDPDRVPSPEQFVQQAGPTAWDEVASIFPPQPAPAPGESTGDDSVWVDGEAVKYFLEPLHAWTGDGFGSILDSLIGARLIRGPNDLKISLLFTHDLQIPLLAPGVARKLGAVYRLDVPRDTRATIRIKGDNLEIIGLDQRGHAAKVQANIPVLPDDVNMRSIRVNLTTGKVRAEAGLFRNWLGVVAQAQFFTRRFEGIDLWTTIQRDWAFVVWPLLLFVLI